MSSRERTIFGKYRVLARLGRGGMGDVYLAVNIGPAGVSKLIVVKELREQLASVPEARSMFLDEARLATRLNHPNVVQTYEVVEDGEVALPHDGVSSRGSRSRTSSAGPSASSSRSRRSFGSWPTRWRLCTTRTSSPTTTARPSRSCTAT